MSTLSIDADLGLQIGGLSDSIKKNTAETRRHLAALKATTPVDVRFQQSGTSAGSGDLAIIFPGPARGFYWHVRRLVVGGNNWASTVAGGAEVYVTGANSPTYVNVRDLADLVDEAASLPNKAFYGQHELVVQPGENLIVVVHSPTASTAYKASVQVQQFRTLPEGIDYLA